VHCAGDLLSHCCDSPFFSAQTWIYLRIEELGGRVVYAASTSSPPLLLRRTASSPFYLQDLWRSMLQLLMPTHGSQQQKDKYEDDDDTNQQQYVYDTCVVVDCSQWLDAMAACTKARSVRFELYIPFPP
jgi:hypothetical protein